MKKWLTQPEASDQQVCRIEAMTKLTTTILYGQLKAIYTSENNQR